MDVVTGALLLKKILSFVMYLQEPPNCIYDKTLEELFNEIVSCLAESNRKLYIISACTKNKHKIEAAVKMINCNSDVIVKVQCLTSMVESVRSVAAKYDFDELTLGNGYRTFIHLADIMALKLHTECRGSSDDYSKSRLETLNEFILMLESLIICFKQLIKLILNNDEDDLFNPYNDRIGGLLHLAKTVDTRCFYGTFLGFQFHPSFSRLLPFICTAMTMVADYNSGEFSVGTLLSGLRRFFDRSKLVTSMLRILGQGDVHFIKDFWKLSESLNMVVQLTCPIAFSKPFEISCETNGSPPNHKVSLRLISSKTLAGRVENSCEILEPLSESLLIYVHGGGFVSQSSESQEIFLRNWAHQLSIPILCVDYSLAPEFPFPVALEEVYQTYKWALQNPHRIGWTGLQLAVAGDSAGGNLILGTMQKCIDDGVRLPKGIFLAYVPVLVSFTLSPSRMLGLMDPLLPFGFMFECMKAYTGHSDCQTRRRIDLNADPPFDGSRFIFSLPNDRLLSPFWAPDNVLKQFPPTVICSTTLDPCLDDSVMIAKRLKKVDVCVKLEIFEGLPHGFLNFSFGYDNVDICREAKAASNRCVRLIADLLDLGLMAG